MPATSTQKESRMYLMIQNPGIAPIEAFTILGVSTSRGNSDLIGQFGSGAKHSICTLLRHNLTPIVFCDTLKLVFYAESRNMKDELGNKEYKMVMCRITGKDQEGKQINRTVDLNFSTEFGELDWTDISMGIREFISNAIDRVDRQYGPKSSIEFIKKNEISIKLVDDNQVRAKSGYTRVFIQANYDAIQYLSELNRRFLHFGNHKNIECKIINKIAPTPAAIYRKGVLIKEFAQINSLFDYNFDDSSKIDESRNMNDSSIRQQAANALLNANYSDIVKFINSELDGNKTFESTFDYYYLSVNSYYDENALINWKKSSEFVFGSNTIIASENHPRIDQARSKGYIVKCVKENSILLKIANTNGIKTIESVLTDEEKKFKNIMPSNEVLDKSVGMVWSILEEMNMTNNKTIPAIKIFEEFEEGTGITLGYYLNGTVYFNKSTSETFSLNLLETIIEEVAHYVTGAKDNSRDMQTFLRNAFAKIMLAFFKK